MGALRALQGSMGTCSLSLGRGFSKGMGTWWGEGLRGWIGTHTGAVGKRGSAREGDSEGMSWGTQCVGGGSVGEGAQWGGGFNGGPVGEGLGGRERRGSGVVVRGLRSQVQKTRCGQGHPLLGLRHLFWKTLPSQMQDGSGRRGWDRRGNDPCHPLSGPVNMRMPMRTTWRRRRGARSAAPQCDPCFLVPDVQAPTPAPPSSQARSSDYVQVGAQPWLWGPRGPPTQFSSEDPSEKDNQLSTSHPASHLPPSNRGNGSHFREIKTFCTSVSEAPRAQK